MSLSISTMRSKRARKALYGGALYFETAASIRAAAQAPGSPLNARGRRCCLVFTL
jgi:hypothetical protein